MRTREPENPRTQKGRAPGGGDLGDPASGVGWGGGVRTREPENRKGGRAPGRGDLGDPASRVGERLGGGRRENRRTGEPRNLPVGVLEQRVRFAPIGRRELSH